MSIITTPGRQWVEAGRDVKASAAALLADDSVHGVYTRKSGGITFYDKAGGEPFGFLVTNRHRERFFVSCFMTNGRVGYMFSTTTHTEELLGLTGMSLGEEMELATKIVEKLDTTKANATLDKHSVGFSDFVKMANGAETSTEHKQAFFKTGLTVDVSGVESDGYLLATSLGRVMLFNHGYEFSSGQWIATTA